MMLAGITEQSELLLVALLLTESSSTASWSAALRPECCGDDSGAGIGGEGGH
jgi:hypothetical protein